MCGSPAVHAGCRLPLAVSSRVGGRAVTQAQRSQLRVKAAADAEGLGTGLGARCRDACAVYSVSQLWQCIAWRATAAALTVAVQSLSSLATDPVLQPSRSAGGRRWAVLGAAEPEPCACQWPMRAVASDFCRPPNLGSGGAVTLHLVEGVHPSATQSAGRLPAAPPLSSFVAGCRRVDRAGELSTRVCSFISSSESMTITSFASAAFFDAAMAV